MPRRHAQIPQAISAVLAVLTILAGCKGAPGRATTPAGSPAATVALTSPGAGLPVAAAAIKASSGPTSSKSAAPVLLPPPTVVTAVGAGAFLHGTVRLPPSVISSNGGNVISSNGGNVISNNGGGVISSNGGNVISSNGGNVISSNGGNVISSNGGNVISSNGGNVISSNGGNVISSNGGNVISSNGGNVISSNGGNIISNNGGGVISNNGGGVISNNGGNFQLQEVPVPGVTVRLIDAAGNPVKDAAGNILTTTTDASGNYSFPASVTGRNLVVQVQVGNNTNVFGFLAKDAAASTSVDIDYSTAVSLSYVLARYVNGDTTRFENLDQQSFTAAVTATLGAIDADKLTLPASLDSATLQTDIDQIRLKSPVVDAAFETIHRKLILVGEVNQDDGVKGVDARLRALGGAVEGANGDLWVFSQIRHTLWRLDSAGILHTVVQKGAWPFPEANLPNLYPPLLTGMAFDPKGFVYLSDSYNNRILRVSADGDVVVICGNGVAGYSGDGGVAAAALIKNPTGLAIDSAGRILFSDSGNHSIRRIEGGQITTVVGDGIDGIEAGMNIVGGTELSTPQGISFLNSGDLLICDSKSQRVFTENATFSDVLGQFSDPLKIMFPISCVEIGGQCVIPGYYENRLLDFSGAIDKWDGSFEIGKITQSLSSPLFVCKYRDSFILDNGSGTLLNSENGQFIPLLGSPVLDNESVLDRGINLSVYGGEIFIADAGEDKIYKTGADGVLKVFAGNTDGIYENPAQFTDALDATKIPLGYLDIMSVSPADGSVYFHSAGIDAVRKIRFDGQVSVAFNPFNTSLQDVEVRNSGGPSRMTDFVALQNGEFAISSPEGLFIWGSDMLLHFAPGHDAYHNISYLTLDPSGLVCGVDTVLRAVVREKNGEIAELFDSSILSGVADLSKVTAFKIGPDGTNYIAMDKDLLAISNSGVVVKLAGPGGLYFSGSTRDEGFESIGGIAVSDAGDLLILDRDQIKTIYSSQLVGIFGKSAAIH